MTKKYQITQTNYFVKDAETIRFHVDSEDYFGTLAAILGLLIQKPELIKHPALREVQNDLLILQKNYSIVPLEEMDRIKKENRIPRGKLISQ